MPRCYGKRRAVEADSRIQLLEIDGCRYPLALKGEDHLQQAREACGCFQMSQVALYRADRARPGTSRRPESSIGRLNSLDLNRVTAGSSRAVRFDVTQIF